MSSISKINLFFKPNSVQQKASKIADIVLEQRRPMKGEIFTQEDFLYLKNRVAKQVTLFIEKSEKIPIVLVGFSMKSPSPLKTISQNADRAEYEAIKHLDNLTKKIKDVYSTGSDFKIYADGRIFVDTIVGSSDERVTQYVQGLRKFLKLQKTQDIEIISPEDFTPNKKVNSARNFLFSEFPVKKEELHQLIEKDYFLQQYKRFMRDFYAKDIRAQFPKMSIKQSKKVGAEVALGVISAAESLDRYVKSIYGDAMLRVSVHAKPVHDLYNKIGIFLNSAQSNCPMPWHGAAIKTAQNNSEDIFTYEKKCKLEKMGAHLIPDLDGKGAYYSF